ncbi:unnamed protein product [Colias eurytheme]|nr:unnamed protein product [Colias eurytheme]
MFVWSKDSIKNEYTSLGFDHIPHTKGIDRTLHIKRSQKNRAVGEKIPPPYPNGWYELVESRDLKIGGVASIDALGQNFCIYRGEDGVARVVDAYCPHLGASFGSGGAVRGNCIECPFHLWRFGENGECTYIPDTKTIPKVTLKTWHSTELDGAVWVWGRNEFIVGTHIRDIPENAADASHLHTVHGLNALTNLGKEFPFLNDIIGFHYWTTSWTKTDDWHIAKLTIDQKFLLMKMNLFPLSGIVEQIGPAHVRLSFDTLFGPFFIVQSITPLGPMLQKIIHRVYSPTWNAVLISPMALIEAKQFDRDVKIWNNKKHIHSPPYVRADKAIRGFRDWYSQFYSEHSVTMRDALTPKYDW